MLKFDEKGLIPAIITDFYSKEVLMMAYMNEESLAISKEEGYTCFYSRSRQKLWRKGEESGNRQKIVSIKADCDEDCLLIEVIKSGPACHTGKDSCFFNDVSQSTGNQEFSYAKLYDLLKDRKANGKEGSYTTYLFEKGLDKILKKVGEESTEVIISAKEEDKDGTVYEIADLLYHLMVLMVQSGITLDDINQEMASRHIIEHKVKQEGRPKN